MNKLTYYELLELAKGLGIDTDSYLPMWSDFKEDYPSASKDDFMDFLKEILIDLIDDYPQELIELTIDILGF